MLRVTSPGRWLACLVSIFPCLIGAQAAAQAPNASDGDYTKDPKFARGVQVRVVADFLDRPNGVSALVPYTFATYPCWDARYALYLLYLGLPRLMKCPAEKTVPYVVTVVVCAAVIALIGSALIGRLGMPAAVS